MWRVDYVSSRNEICVFYMLFLGLWNLFFSFIAKLVGRVLDSEGKGKERETDSESEGGAGLTQYCIVSGQSS